VIAVVAQVEAIATPPIDWFALAPLLILVGGAVVLLTGDALTRGSPPRGTFAIATVVTAAASMVCAAVLWDRVHDAERGPFTIVADALMVDGFSVFFVLLVGAAVILAALLADDYLRREGLDGGEFYVLLLLAAAGGAIMAMANDLIVLFLGLETLSIALYVLAGFQLRRAAYREASMKYFVLGSFSSAFFLYGIALVYGATGSTNLSHVGEFLAGNVLESTGLLFAGFALLLVGLGFKVAAVPFHVWTPDVYQGSPSPVSGFMASASKAVAFAALLRVFVTAFATYELDWRPIVFALAVLSLLVGSVLAIVQTDVKRMLAYSSVNHAGFVLVGMEAATDRGVASALFYLLAYTFMVVGSFGVVTLVARRGDARHELDVYRGLSRQSPALAVVFTVLLLAQAGVPFTSGFLAKFYVITASVDAGSYVLAVLAMLAAVIAAFFYLRVIVTMYMSAGDDVAPAGADAGAEPRPARIRVPAGAALSLGLAVAFTVIVGVLPGTVIDFARDAVPVLVATAS
jgi:NADH-quinone oxidoreductase subunit N